MKIVHLAPVLLVSFILAACGGGGGGSSTPPPDDTMGQMPDPTCGAGEVGTPPNCMPDPAIAKAARDEAMRIEGMIGPTATLADAGNTIRTDPNDEQSIVSLDTRSGFDTAIFFRTFSIAGNPFTPMKATDSPPDIPGWAGWKGDTYTHTDGMTRHTVFLYTDQAPNGPRSYSEFFDRRGFNDPYGFVGNIAVSANNNGVLTIRGTETTPGDNDSVLGNHELFGDTTFGPGVTGTFGFLGAASVTGTFRGVAGTFECQSGCTSTYDADGNLSALSTGWTFTPTAIAGLDPTDADDLAMITTALADLMVQNVIQDEDFTILGWWERAFTDANGDITYSMLPFADGNRNYASAGAGVSNVVGTATYAGPATGLYMTKTITPENQPTDPFTSGQFTADAMLTANFGGDDIAPANQFSITGTVSNFRADGAVIDGDWIVHLNRGTTDRDTTRAGIQNILATGGFGQNGTFDGATDGGTLGSTAGTWSGRFHGDAAAAQPPSASGVFAGHFTNGHVRGAFGVNKQ